VSHPSAAKWRRLWWLAPQIPVFLMQIWYSTKVDNVTRATAPQARID